VTDPDDCARAVAELVEAEGGIDCLVNNAGYAQLGPVEDVQPRKLHDQFDANLYGPHRLARATLPHMREAGDGTIINVSSWVGHVAIPGGGAYCASKAALDKLTGALRAEVGEFGIDVVLIEPGSTDTGFTERSGEEMAGLDRSGTYETLYRLIDDYQRLGLADSSPREVADVVVNAASATQPAARYSVGADSRLGRRLDHLPASWRDAIYRLVSRVVR